MGEKIIPRNYGSIAHLSNSKIDQQTDKYISEGQETIATKKARDWKDLVIIQEKIDGSNVGVYKKDGRLFALTRSGYDATTSRYKQHHYFSKFVQNNQERFNSILDDGERIVGEWMIQYHSIKYEILHEPFVAFDIIDSKNKRMTYLDFILRVNNYLFETANLVHIGQPLDTQKAMKLLGQGKHGAIDEPEGLVYRVEREGKVDFLCKYVRPNKIDGLYMKDEIYNDGYKAWVKE